MPKKTYPPKNQLIKKNKKIPNREWKEARERLLMLIDVFDMVFKDVDRLSIELAILYRASFFPEKGTSASFDFLVKLFDIISDVSKTPSDKLVYSKQEVADMESERFRGKITDDIIDTEKKDAVKKILDNWTENREVVKITSIYPLLDNETFLDGVLNLGIKFQSINEPNLSRQILKIINYIKDNSIQVKHGNPKIGKAVSNKADEFARQIGPMLDKFEEQGIKTLDKKTEELNRLGIKTLRGNDWMKTTVHRTQKRWNKIKSKKSNDFESL